MWPATRMPLARCSCGTVTFTINSSDSGQYVLIWFTKLAPMPNHPNKYQGSIFNVVVTGSR